MAMKAARRAERVAPVRPARLPVDLPQCRRVAGGGAAVL